MGDDPFISLLAAATGSARALHEHQYQLNYILGQVVILMKFGVRLLVASPGVRRSLSRNRCRLNWILRMTMMVD
jgi:hypothetical protein